ncbi:MAG: hypothetical protein HY507_02100 [Candidatus Zambryskibacteria bacterium]|nr:hypothetical protein [Candidatus Zambryskibacteria bacterium]
MFQTPLFKRFFILLLLVDLFFQIGLIFYLDWTTWWFDVVMHFFSGVLVAFAVILVWNYFRSILPVEKRKIVLTAILCAFVVGVLWEIFELYSGLTSFADGIWYILDTIKDLTMNIIGSFFGTLYGLNLLKNNE